MIVCQCGPVSAGTIRDAVLAGARSADEVGEACGAGMQCGTCRPVITKMIERIIDDARRSPGNRRVTEKVGPVGRGSGSTHG